MPDTLVFPKRPKRMLKIDPDTVVDSVLKRFTDMQDDRDRGLWMERRLERMAKYRGLLPEKTYPWPGAANTHPPILQIAEMRANAGLHNVVNSLRPLVTAKATNPRAHAPKEETITHLLDTQLFIDPGPDVAERTFSDAISAFLQDGNWVAFTPWVRDERRVTTVHYRPPVPEGMTPQAYLQTILLGDGATEGLFPDDGHATIEADAKLPYVYTVFYGDAQQREREADCEVYTEDEDDGGGLVLIVHSDETVYDGPIMQNLSISQVYVRTRCANLQPPADYNPAGAPEVFIRMTRRLDDIRRKQGKAGGFNYLDRTGLAKIEAAAKANAGLPTPDEADGEQLEAQRDDAEGREHAELTAVHDEDFGHLTVQTLLCFDRWDVDGDGLSEDVLWEIALDGEVLLEARHLAEKWPAKRVYRPLAEAACIPVPGRYYAISLLELGEHIYDLVKGTLDIVYDSAKISNLPFGFYTASSQFRAETIDMHPGSLYPVPGDPRATVYFPNLPTKDQTWGFNVVGLAMQLGDRLFSINPSQTGQVPTGKASAFRTTGTTVMLQQQSDVRSDQLLLRFFGGIRQVYTMFHAMNRHLLPPGKVIRKIGWEGPAEDAYQTITSLRDIDAEADFDFRPDFLNSNPAMLNQALTSMLGITATPLAFQLGVTDPTLFYNAVKDFARSLRLDHRKYVKPPAGAIGPPLMFEDVISMILANQAPIGMPMEGGAAHLKKAVEFFQDDAAMGTLTPPQVQMLRAWLVTVQQAVVMEQTMAAAGAFQQGQAQQGGGVPTTMQEPGIQAQPEPPSTSAARVEGEAA